MKLAFDSCLSANVKCYQLSTLSFCETPVGQGEKSNSHFKTRYFINISAENYLNLTVFGQVTAIIRSCTTPECNLSAAGFFAYTSGCVVIIEDLNAGSQQHLIGLTFSVTLVIIHMASSLVCL